MKNKNIIPKTQKVYKYDLSITSQFYFCGIPFRLDTSPKCALNCNYCFAMMAGGRNTKPNQRSDPNRLRRRFEKLLSKQNTSINDEFIKRKIPVHFGGMSDPFSDEDTYKTTLELLRILSEFDYPVVLSTKNTSFLLREKVIEILQTMKSVILQISISSIDKKFCNSIEPNTPTPASRLNAIKTLSSYGIPVFSRIQPLFPWKVKEVSQELIPALCENGSNHIIVEFLKLPIENKRNPIGSLSKKTNFDIQKYYQDHGMINVSREWQLPLNIKWELLQPIISSIHQNKSTYGAGDYGLNHLGDTNCCCGIDKLPKFSSYFKSNFAYFIRNSNKRVLLWRDFEPVNLPDNSIKRYIMSDSRLQGRKNTIREFLYNKWNHPNTINSVDSFFGVKFINEFDNDRNCIFEKTNEGFYVQK